MSNDLERWSRHLEYGGVVAVERGWTKTFAIWPVKTISNRWAWLQTIYYRRVLIYNGFTGEPDTQYGDLFDILRT